MSKETLQIEKGAAVLAHENASKNGKKLLEDLLGKNVFLKDVTERIKTFDDVLSELGIIKAGFDLSLSTLESDEVAYRKLKLIAKALNEGWTPNWNDSNWKYWPYFSLSGSRFSYFGYADDGSYSGVGSRLCFKTSALAKYAGETFTDIYKDFMTL